MSAPRFTQTPDGETLDGYTGEAWSDGPEQSCKLVMREVPSGLERVAEVMAQWREGTAR